MPLELYQRGEIWWFRGRIDDIPGGRYHRRSTGASSESTAKRIVAAFEAREIKRHYAGAENALTFDEALLLYTPTKEVAKDLEAVLPHLTGRECAGISPAEIKALGPLLYPTNSTDSWRRHVVAPVRAVINNAHHLGKCPRSCT